MAKRAAHKMTLAGFRFMEIVWIVLSGVWGGILRFAVDPCICVIPGLRV